jgi:alpha-ketoglutarate-dependent taurine dioxygenase
MQISKLSNAGKDQLALLVAQRKVLAFRDQDFADLPIQEALDFGGILDAIISTPQPAVPKDTPRSILCIVRLPGIQTTMRIKRIKPLVLHSILMFGLKTSLQELPFYMFWTSRR